VILPPISVFTIAIAAPNLSGSQKQGLKGKLLKNGTLFKHTSAAQHKGTQNHSFKTQRFALPWFKTTPKL
jgi:hypothetical protein